jgi:hypothetical protein
MYLALIAALVSTPEPATPAPVFAGVEWRGAYAAGHLCHGPGAQAGVLLFGGHLKVGLMGSARPGPLNPKTFEVAPANGGTYKGRSKVSLRSDGGVFGLFVAPVLTLPGLPLVLEVPLAVMQGGYGFYLTGSDRETPDGRRVSAWENELMDGRDSSIGLALEAGVRLAVRLETMAWLQPYVGVHYATLPGFDTYVKGSYDTVAIAIGLQVGALGLPEPHP